jgi:hypothetical protein
MPRKKRAAKQTETKPAENELPEEELPEGGEGEDAELELEDGDLEEDPEDEIPPLDENAEKSKDELYALATQYRIKGRAKMTVEELRAAVAEAQAAGVEPAIDGEDLDDGEDTLPGSKAVTAEQAQVVQQASLDQLEGVAQDPKLEPHLKAYVEGEIAARRKELDERAKHVTLTSPMQRYRVTKGGPFVPMGGPPTTLPAGSMVMATTHDLDAVRRQGIVFEPCEAPKVLHDQLGRPYTSFE